MLYFTIIKEGEEDQCFQQKLNIVSYFTDPLLLSYITSYLTIRQKLSLSCLNKKIRFIMEHYFKMALNQNKLHSIPNKSCIHQMRFYFDRCLNIFKYNNKEVQTKEETNTKKKKEVQSNQIITNEYEKITIQNPFKFNVIVYFEVGLVYTAFVDNQNRAFIFRTNHLVSLIQSKEKPLYEIELGVKQIKCKGERLIILKENGQVYAWQADKKAIDIKTKSTHLLWTIHIPVKSIFSSFNYAIFLLENPHQTKEAMFKYIFNYDIELGIEEQISQDKYYAIAMSHQTGAFYIIHIDAKNILHTAVGHKQAYFINQNHQCLILQFDQLGNRELKAKIFMPLAKKRIVKIYGIYNFFIALQRNIEVIEQWTNEEVINWLRNIGFGDFIKIARAQKMDGKRLQNITKNYMENVLGMNKLNMQQKFMLCINEVIQGKNERDQIWVWGKNDYGQLGVTHANYIMNPHRIKMDFLKDKDRIDTIFCGWYQTYIRTHRGKIYQSTINTQRKKKKVVQEKQAYFSDEQEELKKELDETFKYKNKKRKKTQDFQRTQPKKKEHHKRFEEEVRWTESPAGKAFFVQSFKEFVFYIQCPGQNKFQPTKQKKLRTSKAIIDRIFWDENLNKAQFKIGLIDKDMGTIEVTLYQIQTFDYKETSIRYVKRNNVVVWDRENKIDYL